MFDRAVANDEERQSDHVPAERHGMDVERALLPQGQESQLEATKLKAYQARKRPMRSCFLCLRGKRRTYYAIRIPCHRAELVTQYKPSKKEGESDILVPSAELVRSGIHEDDSKIYEKLVAATYHFYGDWKKWIPFYGIVNVQEIEFSFNGKTDVRDRFEIHPRPLKFDEILDKCNTDLATEPDRSTYIREGQCGGGGHTNFCPLEYGWGDCIEDCLKAARRIKANLEKTYLMRECALDPGKADRLSDSTLEGMVLQKSPIMHNYQCVLPGKVSQIDMSVAKVLPGIEVALGWQTDRIMGELPSSVVAVWFALAVVWVAVVSGGFVEDRNLWVAIGQLIVASLALLVNSLK